MQNEKKKKEVNILHTTHVSAHSIYRCLTMTFSFYYFLEMVVKWMKKRRKGKEKKNNSIHCDLKFIQLFRTIPLNFVCHEKVMLVMKHSMNTHASTISWLHDFANEWWWTLKFSTHSGQPMESIFGTSYVLCVNIQRKRGRVCDRID